MIKIPIVKIHSFVEIPQFMTPGSAGVDLRASRNGMIKRGRADLVSTGIKIALPPGYEAQIRPRSGVAIKYGITLINSPGTIDSDYRGEIMLPLINLSRKDFTFKRGDRLAQMIVAKYEKVEFELVDELAVTARNMGGFGHTGI